MARPKKRAPDEAPAIGPNKLLEALKFLALITKDEGAPIDTHITLFDHKAVAFNGVISAGQLIEEDLHACPHNSTLVTALSKSGEHISFTQLDNHRLSIKSGKFKALVPCLEFGTIQTTYPDNPIVDISDEFKTAMEAISVIPEENIERVVTKSVLMNGKSLVATDGKMIFEYWHGIDLPPGLAIPKSFVPALIKTPKKLAKFGYSQSSVTFFFDDNSWIKSQLYAEPWPSSAVGLLDRTSDQKPLPPDFFKALSAVMGFSPDGKIHFSEGLLHSHPARDVGASYELEGLPAGPVFSAKQLMLLKPHMQTVDFTAPGLQDNHYVLMFYGPNIRGLVSGHVR